MASQASDSPDLFHTQTASVVPQGEKKPTTCWVGVLKHDRTSEDNNATDDYLWVKCSGKTTISKIHEQYKGRIPLEEAYVLVFGARIARAGEVISDLDHYRDRVIALQAVKSTEIQSRLAPKPKPKPLQPSNHQIYKLPPGPPADQKLSPNSSPYAYTPSGPPILPRQPVPGPTDGSHVQDENAMPYNALSPFHAQPNPFAPIVPPRTEYHARFDAAKAPSVVLPTPQASVLAPKMPGNPQVHGRMAATPVATMRYGIKTEEPISKVNFKDEFKLEEGGCGTVDKETSKQRNFQLQSLLAEASPEVLESSVERGVQLLDELKKPMLEKLDQSPDASQWVQQIENLQKQAVKTKTIVGVVGNTGAGKSSVINAMLDEERILGVNCMRACTACVTEVSYNHGGNPYRAEIEFITVADWEKELKILFNDLIDDNGNISRECTNEDTDAGRAYSKIKAVYPKKTKEDIVNSSIEKMLKDVTHLLGRTRKIDETDALRFYKQLQHYVDSKEKSTGDKSGDKEKRKEPKQMEFWPLIRVVRVFVKSPALSTGAVIVDLPGVHDSNAARAAVAEGYMKQCTGLWIVAPINRAVDDKAAKSLLGESFKRQLKMDGSYNSVTFICSKIDDISLMEAESSLNLEEQLAAGWEEMESYREKQTCLKKELRDIQELRATYEDALAEADQQMDVWEALKDEIEDGKIVFAPSSKEKSKKRKNASPQMQRKKQCRTVIDYDEDFVNDDDSDSDTPETSAEDDASVEIDGKAEPLTEGQITTKIAELRATKKEGRRQRIELQQRSQAVDTEIAEAQREEDRINAEMLALCISGRNEYSKGAIKVDFAAGIKELDQEMAAEDNEENFDPNVEVRDYDEVARSLPVFCVSSRGYQKLKGRFRKDAAVPGFKTVEETGIPQLQAHCRKLTEAGRSASCKRFINNLSQLLNSLALWASSDGTGANLTKEQRAKEERFLKGALKKLETGLEKVVDTTCKELKEEFTENIFDKYETAVSNAANEAANTARNWGQKVNRDNRAAGGYLWSTYKAICRRNGVYTNAQGPHDWNNALYEPMMKVLAPGWEKTFARRSPAVMAVFARNAASLLQQFHREVDSRARQVSAGIAGLGMLQQQLRVYEAILKDESESAKTKINTTQKDINREFIPVIAAAMAPAYTTCVQECGPGSFMRMKNAMNQHVDQERYSMFQRSADEVRKRLIAMVREIDEVLNNKADEVYVAMSRDYRSVLGGSDLPHGEMLPKWQRLMRKDVMAVIEGVEKVFSKVLGLEGVDDEAASENVANVEEQKAEDAVPATDTTVVKPEPNDEPGTLSVHDVKDYAVTNSNKSAAPKVGIEKIHGDPVPLPDDSDHEKKPGSEISANKLPTNAPATMQTPSTTSEAGDDDEKSVLESEAEDDDDEVSGSESEDEISESDSLPDRSDGSSESDGD